MKAMILAAGVGSRLKPFTNNRPKALAEINGVTLLEIAIKRLKSFGFNDVIINVHHFADQIIDFLKLHNNFGISIAISDETDLLLDTGGGLKKAAWFFDDGKPFLLHNVDIISKIDLGELYKSHLRDGNRLATLAAMERPTSRELLINSNSELCGWRNNKTAEILLTGNYQWKPISFCGIHVISPEILPLITETGVFSIITTYLRLSDTLRIKVQTFDQPFWMDLGTPESLEKASKIYREE